MTVNKAIKVTGLEIRETGENTWGAFCDLEKVAEVEYPNKSIALTLLVDRVLKQTNMKVFERDGWRCVACGKFGPLQSHHKVKRSKGRVDDIDNLTSLCPACHGLVEKGVVKL